MTLRSSQDGFSYVDIMIALTILLVGVLTLGAALTAAVVRTDESEEQLRAKQVVTSTLESIFSARDLKTPGFTWDAIANDSEPAGVFLTGPQAVYDGTGPDGIVGTADDRAGADGIVGNSDDLQPVTGYQRDIVVSRILDTSFTPPADNLKVVTVTVTYSVGRADREVAIATYVANYQQ